MNEALELFREIADEMGYIYNPDDEDQSGMPESVWARFLARIDQLDLEEE